MKIHNWGRYPTIDAQVYAVTSHTELSALLRGKENNCIARGLGRSYGDSALQQEIISTLGLNRFIHFDESLGLLKVEAGVSLAAIIQYFLPRGWFLSVTPGTKWITVGGAIASDVHGKNHHCEGTFCDNISELSLMLADGSIQTITPQKNALLFQATCGGMGLTGVILSAAIKMKKVESAFIKQTTIKGKNLDTILDLFEKNQKPTYSVAWIDCLAKGKNLGRSLLMLGEHASLGDISAYSEKYVLHRFKIKQKAKLNIPFSFPNWALNPLTIKMFNFLYYNKNLKNYLTNITHYDPFFYPLDGVDNWNRMYGRRGFTQYQFVLPLNNSRAGLVEILEKITRANLGSFLAVLKRFGKSNANFLSFPMEGMTLALDFPMHKKSIALMEQLDELVLKYNGRLYLTKDVRMPASLFAATYPKHKDFLNICNTVDPNHRWSSLQANRLGVK